MAKPITIQEIRTRAVALWGIRGWQAELSRKLPMSTHQVNKIMNGSVKLAERTANHIELLIEREEGKKCVTDAN